MLHVLVRPYEWSDSQILTRQPYTGKYFLIIIILTMVTPEGGRIYIEQHFTKLHNMPFLFRRLSNGASALCFTGIMSDAVALLGWHTIPPSVVVHSGCTRGNACTRLPCIVSC